MQLHLVLEGSLCLPMAYRHHIQGLIYRVLKADAAYAEDLHDGREGPEGRRFKLFTFGQLEGLYRVAQGRILFPSGASLEVRSADPGLLLRLMEGLPAGKEVTLGGSVVKVVRCGLEHKAVSAASVEAVTQSPVVAYTTDEKGYTHFYAPDGADFAALVEKNARRKYKMHYGVEDAPDLKVTYSGGMRKQVTTFKTTRITAWHGRFRLESTPEMLDLLYHTGLGAKSSQGFGMFEIQ